jgi:hypothetical protein
MKTVLLLGLLMSTCSFCCFGPGDVPREKETEADIMRDSLHEMEERFRSLRLEDLLAFINEDSLRRVAGRWMRNDTIPVADSFVTRTVIVPDSVTRVEIFWRDEVTKTMPDVVVMYALHETGSERLKKTPMGSRTGVRLGMDLQEVQNINHEPFYIHGLGGDSSLQFISWDRGRLSSSGLKVNYSAPALTGVCSNHLICGDTAVVSNEPDLRRVDSCYVTSIELRR